MFVDKQKLERVSLDEITKIGNLFDTLKIPYCVFGEYALIPYGIMTKHVPVITFLSEENSKERILEILFKLNYTVYHIDKGVIKARKSTTSGDIDIVFILGNIEGKSFYVEYKGKLLKFSKSIFNSEIKEVWGNFGRGKSGKGFFRVAPLEEIYVSKMNGSEEDISDLEMIKGSGKLDMDRLIKILKKNGMI
jgi:hypothetical protein